MCHITGPRRKPQRHRSHLERPVAAPQQCVGRYMMGFMQAPALTRRRRPFLAPVWLSLLGVLLLAGLTWSLWHGPRTTLLLVVSPGAAAPLATIADPPITAEGEERAQRLARLLGASSIDAVYVSDDRLAQQTAAPLLERLRRIPVTFSAEQAAQLAPRLLREHAGETVLVIGGGGTAAQVLGGASGSHFTAPDSPGLYLISVPRFGAAHLLRLQP